MRRNTMCIAVTLAVMVASATGLATASTGGNGTTTTAGSASSFNRDAPQNRGGLAVLNNQSVAPSQRLAVMLSQARLATAKYANSLSAAKAAGYGIITKMIPDMGYHFMNPKITGFDITKPPILVYENNGTRADRPSWQLGALEWVFTSKPKTPPIPGARYGAFGAACHYADGTVVPAASQDACAKTAPGSGAAFGFWHPLLITLHVWLWYPNPSGLFSGSNPFVNPFNAN